MSKKSDLLARLVKAVPLRQSYPTEPKSGATLLEQGIVLVLMRHVTQRQAEASLAALKLAYPDWNEARVSQLQEIASHIRTGSKKKGVALLTELMPAARALKDYLQDVFQETHGLDLEFLREELAAGGKLVTELSELGLTSGSYLLWVAHGGRIPLHQGLVRLLDRLGLGPRTTSMKKAQEALDPLVPKGAELAYTLALHEVLERWNDPDRPIYEDVDVLREIPYGRKASTERRAQVKRLEAQRKRDEERRITAARKEEERQQREAERQRKRSEAEARRRGKELEKKRRADARKRIAEERKAAAIAAKKAEVERKRLAEVKAKAAAKKAAERAKAAAKKAAAKKAAAKKAAAKKAAAKKAAAKKAAAKKAAAKKAAAKKAAAKKAAARKKPTASKSGSGRTTSRTAAANKSKAKRPASKKASKKKTAKKKTAKKKTAKKRAAPKASSRSKGAGSRAVSKKRQSVRRR